MAKSKTTAEPIMDNEHVKELLAILRENNSPSAKDFLALLKQVGQMERQLDAAVKELAAMRQELRTAQEQNHPVKTALQKAVIIMQGQVLDLWERLAELKQNVIGGCKNAIAAFQEKGISALDNVARFFKIRPILESMREDLSKGIKLNEATISNIEYVSTEYHEAGLHIKNMVRAMAGKEAIQEAKAVGKLAQALKAPSQANLACLSAVKKGLDTALSRLTVLERAAEKKPSIREAIETHNKKIAQAQKTAPNPERPCPSNSER